MLSWISMHQSQNMYEVCIIHSFITFVAEEFNVGFLYRDYTLVSRDSVWMFMKTIGTPEAWVEVNHAFDLARVSSKSL